MSGSISRRTFLGRSVRWGIGAAGAGFLWEACGPRSGSNDRLNVYNWSDYIAPGTLPGFEKETGIRVTYDTYESNEELLAKLQAGAVGYDIIVPSNYTVEILIKLDLLQPLDHSRIPNLKNLGPRFVDPPFDRGNRYSVAYQWGTSGIAYRSDHVATPPTSWGVFWDEAYRGEMTMLDDMREVIGAALKLLGYSLNSTDPGQLAQARDRCIQAKKLLQAYISAPVKTSLIAGDVWIAQLWSGDAFSAAAEEPAIRYAIPREGAALWSDNLCILKSAPHKAAAHAWIDYILRPEVGAAISNAVRYASPNAAARPLVAPDLRANPGVYPPEAVMERLEWMVDVGRATRLYDRMWTEIKAT